MRKAAGGQMIEGRLYSTPKGMVGMACRHPLHGDGGTLGYIETADGDLYAVNPSTMQAATAAQTRRWKASSRRAR